MKIVKLISFAFPAFLASLLLAVNPAQAAKFKATPAIVVTSAQANLDIATQQMNNTTNPIIRQIGCNCPYCVQANLQMLQGKLPMTGI